jgi:anti-repressor protein
MDELKVFQNSEFGELGLLLIDGKEYFPATECAKMLGYSNPKDAILRHCRWVVKHDLPHPQSPDKTIEMNFISEGDLYRLIVSSKLPEAEKFERWVFDEILPAIRKHGMYAVDELLDNPDIAIAAFTQLKEERARRLALETQSAIDRPKVLFADSVAASKQSILVGELAKLLKQNGVEVGQNRLFERLRKEGYLCSVGTQRNMPTQRAMELGIMEIKERSVMNPDGSTIITKTPKITGKGQVYFVNRFCAKEEGA